MDSQSTNDLRDFVPPEEAIYSRMTSPVDTTFIDVEKIGFVLKEIFSHISYQFFPDILAKILTDGIVSLQI